MKAHSNALHYSDTEFVKVLGIDRSRSNSLAGWANLAWHLPLEMTSRFEHQMFSRERSY